MYERHFHLATTPFALTPDPDFLFQGRVHREALAALLYAVQQRRGFTTLVGEVGTGKSTLIHALLGQLDPSAHTALITHTTLDAEEILRMILNEFRLEFRGLSRTEMLAGLADFVIEQMRCGQPPPVLIVDEAQNLTPEVLEEIRLITNLEIAQDKLLQVILSGQPELERTLSQPNLRQLAQRIAVRAKLVPLGQTETMIYVAHRLEVAGSNNMSLFSHGAFQIIYDASGGVPRLINILCEQSLVNTFGAGLRRVGERESMEAVIDVGIIPPLSTNGRRRNFRSNGLPALLEFSVA